MPYLTTIKRSKEPIILVKDDLTTIMGLKNLELSGYSIGNTDTSGSSEQPDANGYIWTLPNGQPLPPVNSILYAQNNRIYFYEDKELTTKFQPIGKTLEECSVVSDDVVGVFTGQYYFGGVTTPKRLTALQVKRKFPFNRLAAPVETEYTLWVPTFVRYNVDNGAGGYDNNEPGNGGGSTGGTTGGGYATGNGSNATTAAKNRQAMFWLVGIGLLIIASNSK